ncbi:hypothetical protein [Campylobacter sputorum]|uniref:hypothetical protein n=2 Tax=Campylobacter sputorum TaxID=206 RepID=UPI00125F3455|nr:hypothetical protein [Campylobacter sputorum]
MLLIFKLSLSIFLALFMVGCSSFFGQNDQKPPKQPIVQKQVQKNQIQTKMIKGYVKSLQFTDKGWLYNIIGIDTTNNKLPSATAYAKKIYYNEKDLVYAIIKGDRISEMYLINASNSRHPVVKKSNRSTKKIIIPVPESENISF